MRPIPFNSYWQSTSIVKNSCCKEDALLLNFSVESAENWEKQQKVATPHLFDHSEQACSVLYPETKHLTWNYKVFKMTKDTFYKQFEFFASWQGRLWGFVSLSFGSLSPAVTLKTRSRSPKPNQLFTMYQCYIHANLVKICNQFMRYCANKKVSC